MTRQLLLSGFFVVGVLTSSPSASTTASYSSAVTSTGNHFTAGTLRISDSFAAGTSLSMNNLIAGDYFDAQLDVTNGGTLGLVYAMTSTVTGTTLLGSTLQLTIGATTTDSCATGVHTVLYTGPLAGAAIGDPAHGTQLGDRTVPAGTTETLCFTVELPLSASAAELLGTTVTAKFVFNAEQLS